ncbi:hypothetical protein ACFYY1_39070 [Streptomyces sp. NPDC001890]|uniref:hypothetical protein n=1 Tax=Streptomyces sp. NPDC001890 TaxID=3364620 RepID=UPI003686ECB0
MRVGAAGHAPRAKRRDADPYHQPCLPLPHSRHTGDDHVTTRPQNFHMASCFTYGPGQQVFEPRDAERTPASVVRTT